MFIVNINSNNENIIKLKKILSTNIEYEFLENKNGDTVLKIWDYWNDKISVYINFNELILLLECYSGINRILSDNGESD